MGRDLGVLVDSKLNMSKQCAAAAKQAVRTLGCSTKGITSREKEAVIHSTRHSSATPGILCSVLVPAIQNRWGQAAPSPEKSHKDGQRPGKPAVRGKAERTGFVQP